MIELRYPKVVAVFEYTGDTAALRTALTPITAGVKTRAEVVRVGDDMVVQKEKVIQRDRNVWEYYPKMVRSRAFEAGERNARDLYRADVIASLEATVAAIPTVTRLVVHG